MNPASALPYLVYFLGPGALALILGRRWLHAPGAVFRRGLLGFFLAWLCVMVVTQTFAAGTGAAEGTLASALVVSAAAGLFEESARFLMLRRAPSRRSWNSGFMYAIGHSGMESIIVGGSALLTLVVVAKAPETLSPQALEQSLEFVHAGLAWQLYTAFERLFVGLLIHACWTSLVVLAIAKSNIKYVFVAMLWHFAHDMAALNLHRISEHRLVEVGWVGLVVVAYVPALLGLRQALAGARSEEVDARAALRPV